MRKIHLSANCPQCGIENVLEAAMGRLRGGFPPKYTPYKSKYEVNCHQCQTAFFVKTPGKERTVSCLISLFFILLPMILLFVGAVIYKNFFF